MSKDKWMVNDCILVPYPDEDLFQDGELNNEIKWMTPISDVEAKIIKLWRDGDITIAQWEDLK